MAIHGSLNSGPDNRSAEPTNKVVFRTSAVPTTPLRIHTVVSQDPTGTSTAVVSLGGELCAVTASTLHRELDQLLRHGVVGLTIDLRDLRLCTSDGLDVFAEFHARLWRAGDGDLQLQGPVGIVARVLQIVHDQDPEFEVRVHLDGPPGGQLQHPAAATEATHGEVLVDRIGHLLDDISTYLGAAAGGEEE